jgi:hypothetical protein
VAGKFWDNSSPSMNLASPRLSITVTQILCIMDGIIATAAGSMVIAMIANGSPTQPHADRICIGLFPRLTLRMQLKKVSSGTLGLW